MSSFLISSMWTHPLTGLRNVTPFSCCKVLQLTFSTSWREN